jgi:hypothetical protein
VWAVLILAFFSFSSRQEYYTIPAVPALALLTGIFLAREEQGAPHTRRPAVWSSAALFLIGAVVAAVCLYFAVVSRTPPPGADLFDALNQHPEDYRLSFGHFFDLTAVSLGFFRGPLLGTAAAMFLGTGAAFLLRLRRRPGAANVALAAGFVVVLMCAHQGLAVFYPILGSEPLAQTINQHWQPESLIVIDGEYTNNSSLNFYTGQPVYMLNGRINGLWYGSLFPDAPHRFEAAGLLRNGQAGRRGKMAGGESAGESACAERRQAAAGEPLSFPVFPIDLRDELRYRILIYLGSKNIGSLGESLAHFNAAFGFTD